MIDKREIYTDGLAQLHVVGNSVRMDFMTLEPKADGQAPAQNIHTRVIMPIQAFLTAFDSIQKLLNKLESDGIIKKKGN